MRKSFGIIFQNSDNLLFTDNLLDDVDGLLHHL